MHSDSGGTRTYEVRATESFSLLGHYAAGMRTDFVSDRGAAVSPLFFSPPIHLFFRELPVRVVSLISSILVVGGISGCIISNTEKAGKYEYDKAAYFSAVGYCLLYIFFAALIVLVSVFACKFSFEIRGRLKL